MKALFALALIVGSSACDRPPTRVEPAAPRAPAPEEAHADSSPMDAGPHLVRPYHAFRVVECARDAESCARANAETQGAPYLVAVGSGRGTLRTREQALTDLYQELRDRTQFGSHLVVRPLRLPVPEAGLLPAGGDEPSGKAAADEPLIAAAFRAMSTVDAEGGVTVDEDHSAGACRVAIVEGDADGGVTSCALEDETHLRAFGRGRR